MPTHALSSLLPQNHRHARAPLPFLGALSLARARVHEFCGPSRRTLALMAARATTGTIIWLRPAWLPERLHPEGVRTTLAACALADRQGIEMPIARQMKAVLHEGKPPREALEERMLRRLKRE